jgi:hypothetical protein
MFDNDDLVEIWLHPDPGTESEDPDARRMDRIEVDPKYLHVESWGLRITGCWVRRYAGDVGPSAFTMGIGLFPWSRVVSLESTFASEVDWEKGWGEELRAQLTQWAETRGLDPAELQRAQEAYARFH